MWESNVGVSYIVNNIARTEEPFGCIKYDKHSLSLMDGFTSTVNSFAIPPPPDQVPQESTPVACFTS